MNRFAPSHHDVIVVGARAAGAATAMLLAGAGLDVLVLDRGRYGADTLSTHALLRGGVVQLHRWGLLDEIVATGTPPIRRTRFHYASDAVAVPLKPSHGIDALYAPRRTLLDTVLVDAARRNGATVRHGASVTGVTRDAVGRVDGVRVRGAGGDDAMHHARWVIGADGLRSAVAAAVGAPIERQGTAGTAVAYGYWADVDVADYEFVLRPDACAGAIPTNGGLTCVFVAATPRRVGRGGAAALHDILRDASPWLDAEVAAGRREGAVRTFGGVPGYVRVPCGPGWALVGDAAYWKDPLTAHGLTDALRDAELLARAIISVADGDVPEAEALDGYHRTRNRLSMPLFEVADTIAAMRWTDAEVPDLFMRLSSAMTDEVDVLAGLDDAAVLAGARP
jgi:2-polyprenyl-6-methoxyphenol hydroxylase-like FAD-dependent oxidoreductase